MVQNVLEDVFALACRQIVEEILWCHLNEPSRGRRQKKTPPLFVIEKIYSYLLLTLFELQQTDSYIL